VSIILSVGLFTEYPWLTQLPWGVQLKLRRAEEHMRALNAAIYEFMETEPYAIGRHLELDGRDHVYTISKLANAPDRIGILAGDCVHCIRSSLDHLAYALAQKGVAQLCREMTRTEFTTISFPIYDNAGWYTSKINKPGMLLIHQDFFAVVEPLQPYAYPNSMSSPLWNISELDNSDKHRVIATTGGTHPSVQVMDEDLPPFVPTLVPWPGEWELGTEVWRFRFEEPHPEMDMKVRPIFSVSLKDAPYPPVMAADTTLDVWLQWICEKVFQPLLGLM
jgi:hypothetical protein